MKKLFKSATALIAFAFPGILTGCLERGFAEENAVLSADIEELVVPADSREGANLVVDSILVTSNRSWNATFKEEVDWVEVSIDENLNLSRVSTETPIILKFKDNKTQSDRSVVLHLSCADAERDVLVLQKAIRYRLEFAENNDPRVVAQEANYVGNVKSDIDTARLYFNTNSDWSAKLVGASTANVRIGASSGSGSGRLFVYFGENEDETETKEATVLISAKGCDDLKVVFTQAKGTPYVRFLDDPTELSTINVPSVGARLTLKVKSNVAWKMKVKDGEKLGARFLAVKKDDEGKTVKDDGNRIQYVSYDEYSAEKGEESVIVAFLGNTDFEKEGTITLQMTAEGAEPAEKTFTLDPLSKVFLGFRKWPDTYSKTETSSTYYQPFMDDLYGSSAALENDDVYKCCNGYEFILHTAGTVKPAASSPTARMTVNSGNGLQLGTGYNMSRIGLPAVPGKRLTKVSIMNGSTSTSTTWLRYGIVTREFGEKVSSGEINDTVGNAAESASKVITIPGGELFFLNKNNRKDVTYKTPAEDIAANPQSFHTYELTGTEVGMGYDIVCLYVMGIRWMELTYE